MANGLQDLLKSQGTPHCVSFGRHEGIRGASWTDVCADGSVHERRYIPNPGAATTPGRSGVVPRERFPALLAQIVASLDDLDASILPEAPTHCLSLEIVWEAARWERLLPLSGSGHDDEIKRLAETFRRLAEEARAEGETRLQEGVEQ